MNTMREILELLETQPLTDIIVAGTVDNDSAYGASRFVMLLQTVYLQFTDRFLLCTSLHKFYLRMEIVDDIIPDDSEDGFCTCSIYTLLVKHSDQDHLVRSLRLYTDNGSSLETATVRSAAFLLGLPDSVGDQDVVFLDPWNTYGIRIGTKQLLDAWVRDNVTPGSEYPPGTSYEEHHWYLDKP